MKSVRRDDGKPRSPTRRRDSSVVWRRWAAGLAGSLSPTNSLTPCRFAWRAAPGATGWRFASGPGQTRSSHSLTARPIRALARYAGRWAGATPDGGMIEFRPGLPVAIRQIGELSDQALVILIDYGGSAAQVHSQRLGSGTALAYRGMKVVTDLLCEPGRQDLTAHVNFDEVSEIAQCLGLHRARWAPRPNT